MCRAAFPRPLFLILLIAITVVACGDDDDDSSAGDDDDFSGDDDDFIDDDDDAGPVDDDDDDDDDDDTGWPEPIPSPSDTVGVFVSVNGNDTSPGTMTLPKKTIAAGIDQAKLDGKSYVYVARGGYTEAVTAEVSLAGGYEEIGWTRDIGTHETVIAPPQGAAVLVPQGVSDITVDGFKLIGCKLGPGSTVGVRIESGPTLFANNRVQNCPESSTTDVVHGVRLSGAAVARLVDNEIRAGTSGTKGWVPESIGVYAANDYLEANGNLIAGGQAPGAFLGLLPRSIGFLVGDYTQAVLVNNLILAKPSLESIGLESWGEVTAVHNVLKPAMVSDGMGVRAYSGTLTLVNNIIRGGTGLQLGTVKGNVDVTAIHNDFWLSAIQPIFVDTDQPQVLTVQDMNACTWIYCVEAFGNIIGDPKLAGNEDPHLQTLSPCIDAGIDPTPWYAGTLADFDFDIDGDARPRGLAPDIGADER
jgi:hypothetical protein